MCKKVLNIFIVVLIICNPVAAKCFSNKVKLQVLGSGGPELTDQRASSSYLIWVNDKATVLVDTGTGSAINFEKANANFEHVQAILFTHLHIDHSQDLPAYIKGSFFTARNKELYVYGPDGNDFMPSTTEFVDRLLNNDGAFQYLSRYVDEDKPNVYKIKADNVSLEKNTTHEYKISDEIIATATAVHHGPVAATAWRIEALGCSITFSGDMSNRYQVLAELAKDSDMLVAHNAIPEDAQGVGRKLHMPASEIGKIAEQAQVKKLLLSHRMKRTLGIEEETEKLIRNNYTGSVSFANDLDLFSL